ncbi:MAG: DUF1015 domain-containing protein [Oscillospiraceae bacterium]|nr:DUF1015 domain-containing protein [Oscillospiraceae bacterium]
MANIKPFKGYRYNPAKISDMGNVVAPLRYNIGDDEKSKLYELDEYNIVKIFDGKSFETDTDEENKYTRAAEYLNKWIADGVIVQDDEEAIYLYEEEIEMNGNIYSNLTFVALLELEELGTGSIRSCEEIKEMSKKDRYDLLAATNADLSMISCLYVERDKQLLNIMLEQRENEPDVVFNSIDGTKQLLWKITDKEVIADIVEAFRDLPLYITDGQTRYSTCVQHRNYMRANNPLNTGEESYNYTMVSLFNSISDGMVIMPEHRIVKLPRGFSEEFFVAAGQTHFKIEKIIVDEQDDSLPATMKKQISTKRLETKFALYHGGGYFYRLTLIDPDYIKKELLPEMSKAYCGLDTVVLRKLILNDLFNIEESEELVSTTISSNHCYNAVKNGNGDIMIVMNPVKVEQIESVTAAGEKMPFRTISMFPKPWVGPIINIKD